ncbi:FAD-dependent thymidylate synthase [Methylosinus sp. PW1]|uniref:FAD-dependent thymidylate synthase n=1 Tax=Methylosinus sp. PW1 TaxID=107636 RepID=UPI0005669506|nr:FAD-dependent thymidylate synthase [Methylosinus sp. PW1]
MTDKIDVLDHGFIRLVEHMGSDLSIVRAARVSYDAAWRAGEDEGSDHKLIHYLWRNRHTTPFESVEFQFEVFAPIFVVRQWHRHRTWTYSELSGRYRELPEIFYVPDADKIGVQSKDNKQGRDIAPQHQISAAAGCVARNDYLLHCAEAFNTYRQLLKCGWPRELARTVLPLSTYTHMFAKVDLRNLFGFLDLRSDPHAQYEIRVYAEAIEKLIEPIVPVAFAAWKAGKK